MHEEILHVGRRQVRRALDEAMHQPRAQRQDALAAGVVARHLLRQAPAARHLVERHGVPDPPVHARGEVVDVVLAHLRLRVHQRNAEGLQQRGVAHARQLQQLRRLHRAQAQQCLAPRPHGEFLAVLAVGHADATLALEQQPRHVRAALHRQVLAAGGGLEVTVDHAPAAAVALRHLVIADPVLAAGVVVRVERQAVLLRRAQEGVGQRKALGHFLQVHRPGLAAGLAAGLIAFNLAEYPLGGAAAPAGGAGGLPAVVVLRPAAHVDHAVDQRRAAQALAARHGDGAAVDVVLRLGGEAPVVVRIHQQLGKARRDRDPHAASLVPRFQHQHPVAAIGRQAVGQDAAGGAAARDNEVVVAHRLVRRRLSPARPAPRPSFPPSARSARPASARRSAPCSRAPAPPPAAACRPAA